MTESTHFRPAKVTSIALGILLFVLLAFAFARIGQLTKLFGEVFLFVPTQLGWVEAVRADEVIPVSMNNRETEIKVSSAGRYAVYTDDFDLLAMSNDLERSGSKPWFRIHPKDSAEYLEINYVARGQSVYDTRRAPGRPVMTVMINQPGDYVVEHPSRRINIYLTPDRVTGNEGRLNFFIYAQIVLLTLAVFWWVRHNQRKQQAKIRAVQQLKKIDPNAFWNELRKK